MIENCSNFRRSDSLQRLLDKVDEPLYDVFLGGSCGKTTWRQDVVIPRLKNINCSYYDPQAEKWEEGMLQKEAEAKLSSRILFWVVHPSASSIVTLIEIAHYAAIKAPLMVVFLESSSNICSTFCNKECGVPIEEVCKARAFVRTILKEHCLPVFSTVEEGIDAVQRKLLLSRPYLKHSKNLQLRRLYLEEKYQYTQEQKRNYIRLKLGVWFNGLTQLLVNTIQIKSPMCVVRLCIHLAELGVMIILSRAYSCPAILLLIIALILCTTHVFSVYNDLQKRTNRQTSCKHHKPPHYDIYLGGSGMNLSQFSWVDSLAVPKFSRYGFSYMHGGYLANSPWNTKESILKECRLILYRLSPNVSIFYAMVELAHLAGKLGDKLIVCIPNKNEFIQELNDRYLMTCTRAACYLEDILNQERIFHTSDINIAIDTTVHQARRRIRI